MTHPPCRTCRLDVIQTSVVGEYPELQPAEPWKFGRGYSCANCGRAWFLHAHGQQLSRIHDPLLPLAKDWNQNSLTLNAAVLEALTAIGGTVDVYRERISVPCAVRTTLGQQFDRALVLVTRHPPHFWYSPEQVHWAGEAAAAAPSRFALPLDVRRAIAEKPEQSMGFAPVGVQDRGGNAFTLVARTEFFEHAGITGDALRRSEKARGRRIAPAPAEAYFFADWFPGCEELLLG